ncbi:MAG: fructose-bisphosphate aldolase [Chloroflexi bacterium]|nr:fructose-bisphosphate aldolase [Chloroflexota bacterium]
MEITKVKRPSLDELNLSIGKKTRLYRLLYEYGPANGTLLLLPVDQGLEHGPRDFFANPDSINPEFQLRIAKAGGYSGIVFHVGLAQKYMKEFAGQVPLVLKINGKTDIPSDRHAFSGQTASVEEAVHLGADAIGYTLYVGSPSQDRDFIQFLHIRDEAERFGMPVIVWAYPRGEAIDARGGRDGLYATDYAARVACELGADIVKLNVPKFHEELNEQSPEPYSRLHYSEEEAVRKVVRSAGRTMVLFAGGERASDEEVMAKARMAMEAGATGLIFGRNMWQRHYSDAIRMTDNIKRMMKDYSA